MLVISRFRYDEDLADRAQAELESCVSHLSLCTGYLRGTIARALDDQTLWVLTTSWEHVGAYRRAMSSYQIKMHVVPLLSYAIDEPSAYEVIFGEGATVPNEVKARGDDS
ncbi:MAG: antibiotic biosynthesis monooxygenase [Propionibacteriales bacterium]|nr:antibiotic biosynthesis monooxygenase [Propionibacteriales bacterium]